MNKMVIFYKENSGSIIAEFSPSPDKFQISELQKEIKIDYPDEPISKITVKENAKEEWVFECTEPIQIFVAINWVVSHTQYVIVSEPDRDYVPQILDTFSANILKQVWKNIKSEKAKEKALAMGLLRFQHIAFGVLRS
jgi:hypothetical protein